MFIVETGAAQIGSSRALQSMFEDRKSVFVDLLKWDVPVLQNRYEIDEFDNELATYIIVADERGDHLGSARLLPTLRPHILGSLFPELCAALPPVGHNVREITRFCLSRRQSGAERRETRNQLVSGLAAYALETGIRTYTGVAEMGWLQQILAFGWNCRPLGPPRQYDCGLLGALAIEIAPDTPDLLAANRIWREPATRFVPMPQAA